MPDSWCCCGWRCHCDCSRFSLFVGLFVRPWQACLLSYVDLPFGTHGCGPARAGGTRSPAAACPSPRFSGGGSRCGQGCRSLRGRKIEKAAYRQMHARRGRFLRHGWRRETSGCRTEGLMSSIPLCGVACVFPAILARNALSTPHRCPTDAGTSTWELLLATYAL